MKMMPGQEPYTQEQQKRLDEMLRAACEAEEEFDLDELEEHSRRSRERKEKPHGER